MTIHRFIYRTKTIHRFVKYFFKAIDILFYFKRKYIVFHGYGGRYVGNVRSFYEYCLSGRSLALTPIWLLDYRDRCKIANNSKSVSLPENIYCYLNHIKLLWVLFQTKVFIASSIGDLYFLRELLTKKNRFEILLVNGSSLKLNGVLAKHLTSKQKRIWINAPKRFDIISATSSLDKYHVSCGLGVSPDRVQVIGPQREISIGDDSKEFAVSLIQRLINADSESKFVLYAPTHRDHISSNGQCKDLEQNIATFNFRCPSKKEKSISKLSPIG